jgi:hypothetical protein
MMRSGNTVSGAFSQLYASIYRLTDSWHNDALVYELYGLTEEEIAIVEGRDH